VVSLRKGCLAAALGFAMVTVLAACDSATAGQPQLNETTSQSSEESTEASTSETEEPQYSLAHLCDLLSPDEAQRLGGSAEGKAGNALSDGHAICTWADKTNLIVGWQTGTSTAQADTGPGITNTPTTVDGLPAVKSLSTDTLVLCEMLVDLPSGKMFGAVVSVRSAGEGQYEPCQVANQLANLIIPRVKDQ
jgi:uncharacterized protein DUF3558